MTSSRPEKASKSLKAFTTPAQPHPDARNREVVFRVALAGTGIGMLVLFILLLISFGVLQNYYVLGRVVVCGLVVLYLLGTYYLTKSRYKALAPFLLVGFYMTLAIGTVWQWGTNTPYGILLLGISIVLASTLLASPNALRAAVISCATVIALQISQDMGLVTPDQSGNGKVSTLGDALGYCVGFSILALISWLFARQTERSLQRAEAAEAALLEEKAMLEVRIKQRTEELRTAQIAEMQQLHQFAEVGQLSTALLHDLANHLTVLTLEIEGIQSQKHATAIKRAQHIIGRLDTMVDSVRDRLRGNTSEHEFNLVNVINEAIEFNRYRNTNPAVKLQWEAPQQRQAFQYYGDPLRLSQIITIVVANAVDAYSVQKQPSSDPEATVLIRLHREDAGYSIRITDHGHGIPVVRRQKLFKEVSSSKKDGMGIGLYLTKQILETQFGGSIQLSPTTDYTEFIISLPKKG